MYHIGAVVADEHNLSIIHEDNKQGSVCRATCKGNKHRTRHPLLVCRKFICNHEFKLWSVCKKVPAKLDMLQSHPVSMSSLSKALAAACVRKR
jgi:hypothetical protein